MQFWFEVKDFPCKLTRGDLITIEDMIDEALGDLLIEKYGQDWFSDLINSEEVIVWLVSINKDKEGYYQMVALNREDA